MIELGSDYTAIFPTFSNFRITTLKNMCTQVCQKNKNISTNLLRVLAVLVYFFSKRTIFAKNGKHSDESRTGKSRMTS